MDEWLNRADISTYLTPKQCSQNNKTQKDFKVEYSKDQQLLKYNGLKDKYLKSYFENGVMKNHLIKIGLILPDGSPKDKVFDFKPHWINQFDEEKAKLKKEADKVIRSRKNNCRSSLGDNQRYQDEAEIYKLPPLQYQIRSQTPKIERPIINKKQVQKVQLKLNTEEEQGLTANQQQQISPQESQNDKIKYFRSENSNLEGLNHLKQRQNHIKSYLSKGNYKVNQSYDGATYGKNSQNNLYNQEKQFEVDNQMINLKLNPKMSQHQQFWQGNYTLYNNQTPIKAQPIKFDQENTTQQNYNFYNQNNYEFGYAPNNNQSPTYQQNQQIVIPNNRYSNQIIIKNKHQQQQQQSQIVYNQNQEIQQLIQQNDTSQIKGNIKQMLSNKNRDNQKQFNFDQPNFPQSTRQKNFQTDYSQNKQMIRNSKDQTQNSEIVPAILSKYQPSPANRQITTKLHAQHMYDIQNMQQKFKTQPNTLTQSPPNQNGASTGDESDVSHQSKQCVQFIIQQINTIEYTPQNLSKDKTQISKNHQMPVFLVDEVKKDDPTKFKEYQNQSNTSQNSLSPIRQNNEETQNQYKKSDHMNILQVQQLQKQQLQQESSKNIIQQSDALQKMIQMQQNKGQQRSVITQKLVLPQSISVDVTEEALQQQKLSTQIYQSPSKMKK